MEVETQKRSVHKNRAPNAAKSHRELAHPKQSCDPIDEAGRNLVKSRPNLDRYTLEAHPEATRRTPRTSKLYDRMSRCGLLLLFLVMVADSIEGLGPSWWP